MISFEFPFAVNDDRDIVIQKVEASCGCTIPDENILNKKLSPSSKHSLVLTMDVHGRAVFLQRMHSFSQMWHHLLPFYSA